MHDEAPDGCTDQEQAVPEAATVCPAPCKLTLDLLTLKVVSELPQTAVAIHSNYSKL